MGPRSRKALAAVLCLCGFLGAAAWLAVSLYPLPIHDGLTELSMRFSGARRTRLGSFDAFLRDSCAEGASCRCAVLVHGLGDFALTWDRIFTDDDSGVFPEGLRLYAVNLPGTGDTPSPAGLEGFGIRAQAAALRPALEGVCPRWTVVGNSLGGWISVHLALLWPEGVEKLILLDSAGLEDSSGDSEAAARILADPTVEKLKAFQKKAHSYPRKVPERAWKQLADRIRRRPVRPILKAIQKSDFLDGKLGGLSMPVEIIWGKTDGVIPPEQGRRFKAAIPGATLELGERCGHLPQKGCPALVKKHLF